VTAARTADRTVADVMSTDVEVIRPDAPADSAWHRLELRGIHHLVVVDHGTAVGVISARDLGEQAGERVRRRKLVSELMTPQMVTVSPGASLQHAARVMKGRGIGCLPVFRGERLVGIVTTTDLLEALAERT
jgi:acetoin utilization protein AcuB